MQRDPRRTLAILTYHRVVPEHDGVRPDDIPAPVFQRHLRVLSRAFNVLDLEEAAERLAEGTLPPRAVAITFDDGYADNCEVALPLLLEAGVPATFFIATGYLDGGGMWNDQVIEALRLAPARADLRRFGFDVHTLDTPEQRRRLAADVVDSIKYLPQAERDRRAAALAAHVGIKLPRLMMSSEQVRKLAAAGMGIGGHTVTHPILLALDDERARREIEDGVRRLAHITGNAVRLFAYPNGRRGTDYDDRHVAMVRDAGLFAAVSTHPACADAASPLHELPRLGPWHTSQLRFAMWLFTAGRRTAAAAA